MIDRFEHLAIRCIELAEDDLGDNVSRSDRLELIGTNEIIEKTGELLEQRNNSISNGQRGFDRYHRFTTGTNHDTFLRSCRCQTAINGLRGLSILFESKAKDYWILSNSMLLETYFQLLVVEHEYSTPTSKKKIINTIELMERKKKCQKLLMRRQRSRTFSSPKTWSSTCDGSMPIASASYNYRGKLPWSMQTWKHLTYPSEKIFVSSIELEFKKQTNKLINYKRNIVS